MKVGLIGKKLGHSFSKTIHESFADYHYELIELNEDEFDSFMKEKDFDGINVTIPYKEKVIPYLDELDDKAKKIKAVNAIKNVNGKLIGTNTDYDGLKYMIEHHFHFKNKIVAICGSGGTSKTAYAVCEALGVKEIIQVARNRSLPYISYEEMKNRNDIEYIINTTSVGMSPDLLSQIVDLDDFSNCKGVVDVVFNPLLTSLCYQAKQKKIPYVNGLEMLVAQAIIASEFFTGNRYDHKMIQRLANKIYHEKQNIVLIGMPSCGKTSLGKRLAKKLGYDFIDIDRTIVKNEKRRIADIFKYDGEEAFRDIETRICLDAAKSNHCVISCGGGVIKRDLNMKALALNGKIIYIRRDVNQLSIGQGRPLSKDRKALEKMFIERDPLYRKYSDVSIRNDGNFSVALNRLMEVCNEDISD
ncbi:MAG: shikimate kinase [Traorella sp.]